MTEYFRQPFQYLAIAVSPHPYNKMFRGIDFGAPWMIASKAKYLCVNQMPEKDDKRKWSERELLLRGQHKATSRRQNRACGLLPWIGRTHLLEAGSNCRPQAQLASRETQLTQLTVTIGERRALDRQHKVTEIKNKNKNR